ncbi:hypothetical protein ACP4OV_000630 [Aristida adscensionis]
MGEDVRRRTSAAFASCWGRLGLAALWRRISWLALPRRHYRTYVLGAGAGGLNYDPLSYAQNFDDGRLCECEPSFWARLPSTRHAGASGPAAPAP